MANKQKPDMCSCLCPQCRNGNHCGWCPKSLHGDTVKMCHHEKVVGRIAIERAVELVEKGLAHIITVQAISLVPFPETVTAVYHDGTEFEITAEKACAAVQRGAIRLSQDSIAITVSCKNCNSGKADAECFGSDACHGYENLCTCLWCSWLGEGEDI